MFHQPFNNSYLQQLETFSDTVMQYEDQQLLRSGRKVIPIERLTENATKQLRSIQKEIISNRTSTNPEVCLSDLIVCELARWFNEEFFTWVDSLPCKKCGSEDVPTKGSYVENGVRVEVNDFENLKKKSFFSQSKLNRHSHAATKRRNSIVTMTSPCC